MSESVLLFLLFCCKYSSVEVTVPSTQWVLLRWVSWMFFYGLDGWNKVHGDQKHFRDTIMKENRSYSLILALLWLVHEDELSVMPIRTSWVMNVSRSLYLLVFIQRRLMTISVGSKHLCQIKCAAQSRCFIWQVTPSLTDLNRPWISPTPSPRQRAASKPQWLDGQFHLNAEACSVI